jgi:hypothetical protein
VSGRPKTVATDFSRYLRFGPSRHQANRGRGRGRGRSLGRGRVE